MATVVVGGHSRNVGKTSVVAGLISAMPEMQWTAVKITQYGHGLCTASGEDCECASHDESWAIDEESSRTGDTDTSRFLNAGAARALWVRTKQGMLAEAMPELREKLSGAKNVIMESNSVIRFVRPDIYLVALDAANPDFKDSSREFLDRADAVLLQNDLSGAAWRDVSMRLLKGKPVIRVTAANYVTDEVVSFVRAEIAAAMLT